MLSSNLKSLRKLKGWTRVVAAENLKVKLSTYQSYEDARAEPGIAGLISIADTYSITVDQLIREDLAPSIEEEMDIKEFERLKKKIEDKKKKK